MNALDQWWGVPRGDPTDRPVAARDFGVAGQSRHLREGRRIGSTACNRPSYPRADPMTGADLDSAHLASLCVLRGGARGTPARATMRLVHYHRSLPLLAGLAACGPAAREGSGETRGDAGLEESADAGGTDPCAGSPVYCETFDSVTPATTHSETVELTLSQGLVSNPTRAMRVLLRGGGGGGLQQIGALSHEHDLGPTFTGEIRLSFAIALDEVDDEVSIARVSYGAGEEAHVEMNGTFRFRIVLLSEIRGDWSRGDSEWTRLADRRWWHQIVVSLDYRSDPIRGSLTLDGVSSVAFESNASGADVLDVLAIEVGLRAYPDTTGEVYFDDVRLDVLP